MNHPTKQWTMTQAQFDALEVKVNQAGLGVQLHGTSGSASEGANTISFSYAAGVLTVSVDHALPFTAGVVMGRVAAAIDQALAAG